MESAMQKFCLRSEFAGVSVGRKVEAAVTKVLKAHPSAKVECGGDKGAFFAMPAADFPAFKRALELAQVSFVLEIEGEDYSAA